MNAELADTFQPMPEDTFTIWTPSQLIEYVAPEDEVILGDGLLMKGQISAILGPGAVGKSRAVMQLALAQITGVPWFGIPTRGVPLRWLLIGNENSRRRQQRDLIAMMRGLSEVERELVNANLLVHVSADRRDMSINLGNSTTEERFRATFEKYKPDVVILDPFANVLSGDMNSGEAVHNTLNTILEMLGPQTALLIVHHSRTGAEAFKKAVGWDRSEYGKGSKDLYSRCRAVINIAPADADGGGKIVAGCGKSNDCAPFEGVGLVLNPNTMCYEVDPDFDFQAWIDDLDGKRSKKVCPPSELLKAVQSGLVTRKALHGELCGELGASPATIDREINNALKAGYLSKASSRGPVGLTDKGRQALAGSKISFVGVGAAA